MMALAFGPGRAVLMSGVFMSLPLPAGSRTSVFEQDAARVEVLPDPVRLGEVARLPGGPARGNQRFDLLDRHRGTFLLPPAERQDAEDAIELFEGLPDRRRVA